MTNSAASVLSLIASLLATTSQAQVAPPAARTQAQAGSPAGSPSDVASFTLPNGLHVVVRPDRRLPIATVVVVYNVGSKDERAGQFGYAHLFEHLMLDGSAHAPGNTSRALRDLGATDTNATTTQDRTIFYETVPRAALERVLFLEADRMGYLADALTAEKVTREVGVVLSEKRLRGEAPFGTDEATIAADLYPADHPYHHSVIGTEADLRAITVQDAADWFRTYYGPANATLILTGDIGVDEARTLATRYFAALAPRAPLDRLLARVSPPPGAIRREQFEPVPIARIYATWAAPPAGSPAIADLDLIAQIVGNGATARLRRHLVDELGVAQAISVAFDERLLSSEMGFVVDVASPDKVRQAEAAMDAVLARFVAEGPTQAELDAARTARIGFVRRMQESVFGKAFLLMRGASLTDDPDYAATYLTQLRAATPDSVRRTAEQVYGRAGHHLIVRPLPGLRATPGGYDPAKGPPPLAPMGPIAFPATERTRLSNGLEVVLVPRPGAASVNLLLRFDAGSASAPRAVAGMAVGLLTGLSGTPQARAIATRAEALGGRIGAGASQDFSDVSLSMDPARVADGIALLGDVVRRPVASPADVATLRQRYDTALAAEGTNIGAAAQRVLRNAVYGAAHPYGANADPARDIAAIGTIDAAAVNAWDRAHLRPDRARLYVAGDTTMAALRPLLEQALRGWRGDGPVVADRPLPAAVPAPAPSLTVIDRPGSAQSYILAGRLLPPTTAAGDPALDAANEVYGGNFTSRIGTNLRQDRGWTYGIGSGTSDARGQRLWEIAGNVDRDHTGDSIAELLKDMRALTTTRPPEQGELDRTANASVNAVAAKLEDMPDLLRAMANSESFGRSYDAIVRDPARLRALSIADVRRAAGTLADPAAMHWVVVGDWGRIRSQLTDLGLGTPIVRAAAE